MLILMMWLAKRRRKLVSELIENELVNLDYVKNDREDFYGIVEGIAIGRNRIRLLTALAVLDRLLEETHFNRQIVTAAELVAKKFSNYHHHLCPKTPDNATCTCGKDVLQRAVEERNQYLEKLRRDMGGEGE